ncbi:SPOR domain-containing protein [Mangrovibacterium diazotrophicum]|uniref:Sporulation related protein n=1 Tax=Mangrovibacterium diazotrophicum TaxID=1261403 RepID=A0A419W3Q6_9BACT|nr:SPOR domain-containing protein [Mangrovibacterium diazotrophicum]RKD90116.1 sporulation related protein [Mangrovibacterium diazotrophicum]
MKKLAFTAVIALLFFASCKDKPKKLQVEKVVPKVEEVKKDTIQKQVLAPQPIEKPADKYFLISGSFLKEEQAETYKSELETQGYPAQVVQRSWGPNSEYFRVAMYGYHEKGDAYADLSKAQQEGKVVWLLVK